MKTGFILRGLLIGFKSETRQNSNFTDYIMGVAIEGRPDEFGRVGDETMVVSLNQQQYQEVSQKYSAAVGKAVEVPVAIFLQSGTSKNGKPYAFNRITLNGNEIAVAAAAKPQAAA